MRLIKYCTVMGCMLFLITACYYSHPSASDGWTDPEGRVDSASFAASHHYAHGYNFRITADSLVISCNPPGLSGHAGPTDSLTLYRKDKVVVADIVNTRSGRADSIWIKVARDQSTQGWTDEATLLAGVIPDDPISAFIHYFSDTRLLVFVSVLGVALLAALIRTIRRRRVRMIHFNDIPSFYPTLQCLAVSAAAVLYGSILEFVPQTWVEFYYHPTLNPFGLPPILSLFVAMVWLNLITALAVVDDVRRCLPVGAAVVYLMTLLGACVVLYLSFTLTVGLYVGYLLFAAYVVFALRRYLTRYYRPYRCGRCGKGLTHLGTCPHCGARNE